MHRIRVLAPYRLLLTGFYAALLLGMLPHDVRPVAASTGDIRVLYLFEPSSPDQLARFDRLQQRARQAGNVELIGLSRETPVPPGIRALEAAHFVQSATFDAASRRWVATRLTERGEALRVERPEAIYTSDGARTIEATAAKAGVALLPTDIDFSTWGKVKDLFR